MRYECVCVKGKELFNVDSKNIVTNWCVWGGGESK